MERKICPASAPLMKDTIDVASGYMQCTQHPHFTNTLMMPTSTTFDFFSTNHDTLNMEEGQTPQFHVDVGQSTNVIGRDDRGHYVNQQGRISRNSSTQD
ncbi:hypothetical protein Csa_010039 [Cucumis sativus]|nr:hypothetical protein Csa_010039 [Cucumis sativus]